MIIYFLINCQFDTTVLNKFKMIQLFYGVLLMIQTFAILTLYEAVVSLAFIWKRQKATPLFIAFSIQNIAGFLFANIA
jgi:hypothetical protein